MSARVLGVGVSVSVFPSNKASVISTPIHFLLRTPEPERRRQERAKESQGDGGSGAVSPTPSPVSPTGAVQDLAVNLIGTMTSGRRRFASTPSDSRSRYGVVTLCLPRGRMVQPAGSAMLGLSSCDVTTELSAQTACCRSQRRRKHGLLSAGIHLPPRRSAAGVGRFPFAPEAKGRFGETSLIVPRFPANALSHCD